MNFSRFRPPNYGDEIASCQSCNERFHYTALDDEGFCEVCRPEKDLDDSETDNKELSLVQ